MHKQRVKAGVKSKEMHTHVHNWRAAERRYGRVVHQNRSKCSTSESKALNEGRMIVIITKQFISYEVSILNFRLFKFSQESG